MDLATAYRAQVAKSAAKQADHRLPARVPSKIALDLTSGYHLRKLLRHFRPRFTPWGDTPHTQWARLVTLYFATAGIDLEEQSS